MTRNIVSVFSVVIVAALAGSTLYSQESSEPKSTGRRLPNYFSGVGLRQSQREQIYSIQDKYAEQIEELIRQVEELRKKRDAELEQVLDAPQRAELVRLVAEAAARSKAKRAMPKSSESESKPGNQSPE